MVQKNICFFNSSKTWGGGEKWHYDMAVRLNNDDFNSFVIAGKQSELALRMDKTDVPHATIRISNLSFLNPIKIFRIFKILQRENIQTIIINLSEDLKVAGPAAKLAGVKNIIYRRGSAIPVKNSFSNRLLFKNILSGIIANSEKTRRTILENNVDLFPREKIEVIYNGISLKKEGKASIKPLYQRQGDEIILGNAGRMVAQKGQIHLIEMAKLLKKKNINFKLLIAGEGKLMEQLNLLAQTKGVSENILFLGFVEDIQGFMKSIDIFLLPSLWEGFGYVIVEAMAAAKPVIAFDVSSNPELITDNQTGYLVKDMNVADFAEKIECLARDYYLRITMGLQGKEYVENKFDIKMTVKALERYLDRLPY